MAQMTMLQRLLLVVFYCLTASRGAFLSMLSQGQVSVFHSGQAVILDCEFYTEFFNLFDNPVLWKKTQRDEVTPINIMGNIVDPFIATGRFDVTFEQTHPRYRLKLKIVDLALEDSGNYTCEVRGTRSSVLGVVTHYVFVRAPVETIFISNTNSSEEGQSSRIRGLSFVEHKPSTVRCISVGGYPPPEMDVQLGNQDITDQFAIRHAAELKGVKGLRLMIYQTERWTHNFRARATDDGERLKCIVTVAGLGSNISHVKMHVQYAPIITCQPASAFSGDKNVYLMCEVKAKPSSSVLYWSVGNGTQLSMGEVINEMWTLTAVRNDVIETKLFLRMAHADSFKTYKIIAENSIARTTKDVLLAQKYKEPTRSTDLEIIDTGPHRSPNSPDRRSKQGYTHVLNSTSSCHHGSSFTFKFVSIFVLLRTICVVFINKR